MPLKESPTTPCTRCTPVSTSWSTISAAIVFAMLIGIWVKPCWVKVKIKILSCIMQSIVLWCQLLILALALNLAGSQVRAQASFGKEIKATLQELVLKEADNALHQEPVTVTASIAERRPGGPHAFYSEGDYWWPDPEHPHAPAIHIEREW